MPVTVAQNRAGLRAARVGASFWFGQTKGPELLTTGQRGQITLFLLFAAKEIEWAGTERGVRLHRNAHRGIAARNLLNGQAVRKEISASATVFFRERQAEQTKLAHSLDECVRKLSRVVHFFRERFNLLLSE